MKWVDEGTLPPVIGGYFLGFINNMLSENFQTGLQNLKAVAEKRRAAAQAAPAEAARPGVRRFVGMRRRRESFDTFPRRELTGQIRAAASFTSTASSSSPSSSGIPS